MKYLFILLLTVSFISKAQYTVDTVPNQKLIDNSYVSNPDKILRDETAAQLNVLLDSLERKTSVQVAVVALQSIGEADHIDFAQQLFTKWGIGQKENDNGLLVLLIEDKHNLRFHTGYGLESTLTDALSKRIQINYMVPEFKNGDYDAGMLAGLIEVNKVLTNPNYADELIAPEVSSNSVSNYSGIVTFLCVFILPVFFIVYLSKYLGKKFADSKNPASTEYPDMRLKKWQWLTLYLFVPLAIIIFYGIIPGDNTSGPSMATLYFYYMATLFVRLWRTKKVINRLVADQKFYEVVEFLRKQQGFWFGMIFLFPVPFFFYFFYHLARKKMYRNHPRNCPLCQGKMIKHSEKTEDQYLNDKQQMEETLQSNNYDVWQCESCQATDEWVYPNKHSKYSACPKCKTKAYYSAGRKTLVSASYTSSGKGEETYSCKFCNHTKKSTYTIAKRVHTTSSSSSGSSYSSSSSSSSGGSWGGGSSGGGGASSSW